MTAKAFVLIETEVGKNAEVVQALVKLEGMKSVNAVMGPYDTIAIVEAGDLSQIGDIVTAKIHHIAGVCRTVTCPVL